MSLRIVFLGTAASIPTSTRALSAVAVQREGELFLFDCGEGTQRQMIQARIGFNRKTKIFITHLHGDHILGLPGLLQTMSLLGRDKPLQVYGPEGTQAFLEATIKTVQFSLKFPVQAHEIKEEGLVLREKEYGVYSAHAEHSVPTLAYALTEKPRPGRFHPERASAYGVPKGPLWSKLQQGEAVDLPDGRIVKPEDILGPPRPGRKIVYVADTKPSDRIAEFSKGADILIHEATFAEDLAERAEEDLHSTPSGAALVAKKAEANLLVLTHLSARYGDTSVLLEEAKNVFPEVVVAEDFMTLDVPLKE
ncbi:MAG: ribonuclease Z [Candidatus Bathyarchaeota archaeon]|nr:ribonuclease Z [Candidatus Bathyarchaeota archaeon]